MTESTSQNGLLLSCYVVPAVFQQSSNPNYQYHAEFYAVHKNGYVVFDFLDSSDMQQRGGDSINAN